jgi:hypothetical protein
MKRTTYGITVLLAVALIGGVALAAGGAERLRQVIGGGATSASAGDVILQGTLGQPIAGRVTGGEDVAIGQGYWLGGGPASYPVYLPLVLRE